MTTKQDSETDKFLVRVVLAGNEFDFCNTTCCVNPKKARS